MVHVLQSQQGNTSWLNFIGLAILCGGAYDDAYNFNNDDLGLPLYVFNMEQQARIIEFYYTGLIAEEYRERCRKTIGDFQTNPPPPSWPYGFPGL